MTTPDSRNGETMHLWPEILPDGRAALFTIRTAAGVSHVGLVSRERGVYRVLLEDASFARNAQRGIFIYVREGVVLAAPFELERLELTGEPVAILEGLGKPCVGKRSFRSFAERHARLRSPSRSEERSRLG